MSLELIGKAYREEVQFELELIGKASVLVVGFQIRTKGSHFHHWKKCRTLTYLYSCIEVRKFFLVHYCYERSTNSANCGFKSVHKVFFFFFFYFICLERTSKADVQIGFVTKGVNLLSL
jgi:hypothetical protein